jgi:hypothetical protein
MAGRSSIEFIVPRAAHDRKSVLQYPSEEKMRRFATILMLLAATPVSAQDVDELVAGVGVEWGAMLAEVESVYPGGVTSRLNATDFNYDLDDSRPIFGLDRTGGDSVQFGFIDGALASMRIQFPDCAALVGAIEERAGPPDVPGDGGEEARLLGTWQGSNVTLTAMRVLDCTLVVTRALL